MKPTTFATICCMGSAFLWHSHDLPAGNGVVLHHSHSVAPKDQLKNLVLPAVPFLTNRARVHRLDVLKWLEGESRAYDPEGKGVKFIVKVEDKRAPGSPDTMARWRAGSGSKLMGAMIRNASLGDYLLYLSRTCEWTFERMEDAIIVRPSGKKRDDRSPKRPPAPDALPAAPAADKE